MTSSKTIPILITNDDGIDAPGLEQLIRIFESNAEQIFGCPVDLWVVAPTNERSGASHAVSLAQPLRITQKAKQFFSVLGTPVDCVLVALNKLMPRAPKFLFSGINKGRNAADDIALSGTVAAALQGMHAGVPSFALSQEMEFSRPLGEETWQHARDHAPSLLRALVKFFRSFDHTSPPVVTNVVMNINFPRWSQKMCGISFVPHATGYQHTKARVDMRQDLRFQDYYWIGYDPTQPAENSPPEGTDIEALTKGYVTVTPLSKNWNSYATIVQLRSQIKNAP